MSASTHTQLGWRLATIAGIGVLLICAGMGLFARFHALGERQLAVDEYYTLTSVDHIVEQGLPAFPDGGYYGRDLPGQYITAACVLLFGDSGFAKRLPPALFGLGSVALLFFYARPQLGRALAAVLAIALLISSWEVEFSRFARMYAEFQFATLAFLIAYDRCLLGDHWNRRYLAHAAGIALILSHDLGVFLLPLLFVPLLIKPAESRFPSRAHAVRYAFASAATVLAAVAYTRIDFRNQGVGDRYPTGSVQEGLSLLRVPDFPFWHASSEPVFNLALLIAALALSALLPAALGAYRGRRDWDGRRDGGVHHDWGDRHDWAALGLTGLLLCSVALHAFVISAVCVCLLLFRHEVHRRGPAVRGYRAALIASFLIGISWFAYALLTRGWAAERGGSLIGALRRAFFGWPDFYSPIAVPWASGLPLIGGLTALAVAHQLWRNRTQPLAILARNPALPIIAVAIALGVFRSLESGMRYAYFIYPVAFHTVALSILQLTRQALPRRESRADAVAALIFLTLFAVSGDFSPRHLFQVAGPEASFRIGRFEGRDAIWYPRYDYASAAMFLENNAAAGVSAPIIAAVLPPLSHYLELDHAVFYPRGRPIFGIVSRARGTRELWSQRRLLSTPDDLRAYTADAETVWVVRLVDPEQQPFQPADVWADRIISADRKYLSQDGRVEVLALTLRPVKSQR